MKVFVTGGTGFIGRHLVRKLLARGYYVHALVHNSTNTVIQDHPHLTCWKGDITDRESLLAGMQSCEAVFHLAGWYKLGSRYQDEAESTNVDGTRNVFEISADLGMKRVVYTSTLGIYGDTKGHFSEEGSDFSIRQDHLTEYDRTKWIANYQIAQPMIAKGVPITIVLPGVVYGPGDHSLIAQLMEAYIKGWLVLFPGPETFLSFAHVEDVAEGHILALEKGNAGESYILTGTALPLWQAVELWAALLKKYRPLVYVPANKIKKLKPLARQLAQHLNLPDLISLDGIAVLGASYIGRSDKAKQELGWESRPLELGFKETLDWFSNHRNGL